MLFYKYETVKHTQCYCTTFCAHKQSCTAVCIRFLYPDTTPSKWCFIKLKSFNCRMHARNQQNTAVRFKMKLCALDIALLVIIDLLYGAGGDLLNPQKR